jgi:hypothetical protein
MNAAPPLDFLEASIGEWLVLADSPQWQGCILRRLAGRKPPLASLSAPAGVTQKMRSPTAFSLPKAAFEPCPHCAKPNGVHSIDSAEPT